MKIWKCGKYKTIPTIKWQGQRCNQSLMKTDDDIDSSVAL